MTAIDLPLRRSRRSRWRPALSAPAGDDPRRHRRRKAEARRCAAGRARAGDPARRFARHGAQGAGGPRRFRRAAPPPRLGHLCRPCRPADRAAADPADLVHRGYEEQRPRRRRAAGWSASSPHRPQPRPKCSASRSTDRVARLSRLRFVDGEPVAIETAVVPEAALADPSRVEASLYDALATAGMHPVRAVQGLVAVALGAERCRALLGVPEGAAAVAIERATSHRADGSVVEFTRSLYRGDACAFVAELTVGPRSRRPRRRPDTGRT